MVQEILIVALALAAVVLLLMAIRWLNDASTAAQPHMKRQQGMVNGQPRRDIMGDNVPEKPQQWHTQGLLLGTLATVSAFLACYIGGSQQGVIFMAFLAAAGLASFLRCFQRLRVLNRRLF